MEKKHEEYQYLELVDTILKTGNKKNDRTNTGTLSVFGGMHKYSLDTFPLLTTKKVFTKAIILELLWFIKGDTNANHLSENGVKIWDPNTTREFLDSRGLYDSPVGDIGPLYGHNWKHFGAEYINMDTDYTGQGVNQLQNCIDLIKNDPNSRRIVMTAFNPKNVHQAVLLPCHMFCQFYVNDGYLSCLFYQRSCDLALGVPFNIASYALLTCMIAHSCGLKPGELIHSMGDIHIYNTHIDKLNIQITRTPKPFPKLVFKCEPKQLEEYTVDDFEIVGYESHPGLKMEMAV